MEDDCKAANLALERALQAVKNIKPMRLEYRPLVEDPSHGVILDTVTKTTTDLRKALSSIVRIETSDSDDDESDA